MTGRTQPGVITDTTPTEFFQDSVAQAMGRQQVQADDDTTHYLVSLLTHFIHAENLYEETGEGLGLRPLRDQEPEDLYEIIRQRYLRGAIVVTSNRAVEEWYPLFGDALMASAAMDRLLHNAHVLRLEGDSFRNPPPKRRRRKSANGSKEQPQA